MMISQRHHGFVVGSNTNSQRHSVWRVRVKDPESPYDNLKLIVASVHNGLELARGLNVHFAIGTVDDSEGEEALRAVDVDLESPTELQCQQVK